jgi:hypothetical protein
MTTATCAYCLVANRTRPRIRRLLKGLPHGGPLRLIEVDAGLWLVVSDVPLSMYGEAALKKGLADLDWVSMAAVAHETAVESFRSADAVLPMKLFTIFGSGERARQHFLKSRASLNRLIARVTRMDEWGVRVAVQRPSAGRSRARAASASKSSGSSYLLGKKAQRDRVVHRAQRARAVAADLFDELAAHAAEARRRPATELPADGGPLVLDAALLVPRSGSTKLKNAAARQARALLPEGYAVSLTGPWPPYSFMQD